MKKRYGFLMIVVGIIIGLGISMKSGLQERISAKDYFIEESSKETNYKDISRPFISAAQKVQPATVYIYTEKVISPTRRTPGFEDNDPFREFFGDEFFERFFGGRDGNFPEQKQTVRSLGSGVIVSPDGYIITNNHVVESADKIKVKFDKDREYDAKLISGDKKSDIAVLKIENATDLPFAKLGDSDKLEVGEWIIAIGNPFGLTHTVTSGIVSAMGRNDLNIIEKGYEDFIQTDCSINPGNSGGPMINLNGNVIGINTAIYSRSGGNQGIGFAIPINMVKKIMTDLIESGKVNRGYLGVIIGDVTDKIAKKFNVSKDLNGALISQVYKNSPADKAGLKEGDIIIEFNDVAIANSNRLKFTVAATPINKKVPVKGVRDGSEKTLYVTIVEQPKDFDNLASNSFDDDIDNSSIGLGVQNMNQELAEKYGYSAKIPGVIIVSIKPNSVAERSGLRKGDIIIEIDRIPVRNIDDYRESMEKNADNLILMKIQRRNQRIYLTIEK